MAGAPRTCAAAGAPATRGGGAGLPRKPRPAHPPGGCENGRIAPPECPAAPVQQSLFTTPYASIGEFHPGCTPKCWELELLRARTAPPECPGVPGVCGGTTSNILTAFALQSRSKSGLDCLVCAIFIRDGSIEATPEEILQGLFRLFPNLRAARFVPGRGLNSYPPWCIQLPPTSLCRPGMAATKPLVCAIFACGSEPPGCPGALAERGGNNLKQLSSY